MVQKEGAELRGPSAQGPTRGAEEARARGLPGQRPVVQNEHQFAMLGACQGLASVGQLRHARRAAGQLGPGHDVLDGYRHVPEPRVATKQRRLAHDLQFQTAAQGHNREIQDAIPRWTQIAPCRRALPHLLAQHRPHVRVRANPVHWGQVPRLHDEDLQHAPGDGGRGGKLGLVDGVVLNIFASVCLDLENDVYPENPHHRPNQAAQRSWHRGVARVPPHDVQPCLLQHPAPGALGEQW
mmetsp:Transcript_61800/g.188707  ORF Transcript_61800/g.188707 Transcript_61800/m.188707 type:complete len:239 (+) Transcript_61800:409-1125(+)